MERARTGTSYKRLRKILKKFDVPLLAIFEPFMKEKEVINRYTHVLDFLNYCTNEAMGGKFLVMWKSSNAFNVMSMFE